ncbi:membrane protein [Roseibium aquae]|uniref:Membrane protein n=1 Tax=Roseibium aquae TaxID=1323746 RepID=A0A916TJR8_9HYPH|nr:FixH family protein [Roseibium aquae]GGB48865.1 membrane protein [Roseibium aquae]
MTMTHPELKHSKPVTGRTVLIWLLCFFGVIFAVNGVFLYFALGTFPGVAVESSYEAGQAYNQEIAAAKAQAERGWQVETAIERTAGNGAALSVTALDLNGRPIVQHVFAVDLKHPTTEDLDRTIVLSETAPGIYTGSIADLHSGNWNLVLHGETSNGETVFRSQNRVWLAD